MVEVSKEIIMAAINIIHMNRNAQITLCGLKRRKVTVITAGLIHNVTCKRCRELCFMRRI